MCGRFTLKASDSTIRKEFGVQGSFFQSFEKYNIAPGTEIPIIYLLNSTPSIDLYWWGLIPFWTKNSIPTHRPINARSESIMTKPTFRKPYLKQRCLIPASGFYEWDERTKPKQPFYFHLEHKSIFAFAGIWDSWISPEGENINTCCLITKSATDTLTHIHDRIPVVIHPNDYTSWFKCEDKDFFNDSENNFKFYPVSTRVNSGREEGVDLIEPI